MARAEESNSAESPTVDLAGAVELPLIDARAFEDARDNPAVEEFLRDALAQDERLEREGLIHP